MMGMERKRNGWEEKGKGRGGRGGMKEEGKMEERKKRWNEKGKEKR